MKRILYLSHATPDVYRIIRACVPSGFELVTLDRDSDDERRAKAATCEVLIVAATPLRTPVERSIDSVEGYVRDFAEDNPHVSVSLLRFANVIGDEILTPLTRALQLPVVPSILGFDPRFQFVHEDDVIRSILFVLRNNLAGVYNVAGDGLLPWSEVAALCGRRTVPMSPVGTGPFLWPWKRLGLIDLPEEYLHLLRYGRGVDNRKLKQAGFAYQYTSSGVATRTWWPRLCSMKKCP